MSYSKLPDRTSYNLNSAADINQLTENIDVVKTDVDGDKTDRIEALEALKNVPIRQTVLTGPVDAYGRADFIEAGTGLEVVTKDVDEDLPLIITYGSGFDSHGQKDYVKLIDSALSWSSLTASSTLYLYIDYNISTGAVTTGFTSLVPVYDYIKPAAPSTGQYWYPIDHRCAGEYYTGSEWTPVIRIFIGEVVTGTSSITSLISYAYQGFYRSDIIAIAATTTYSFSHNLGCWDYFFDENTRLDSSYTWTRQTRYYPNSYYGYAKIQYSHLIARMSHGGQATFTGHGSVSGQEAFSVAGNVTGEAYIVVKRAW